MLGLFGLVPPLLRIEVLQLREVLGLGQYLGERGRVGGGGLGTGARQPRLVPAVLRPVRLAVLVHSVYLTVTVTVTVTRHKDEGVSK